jgi:toxin ParE1/3/4
MPKALLTRLAKLDLIEILAYFYRHSPAAADRFAEEFDNQCRLLARFPKMGASKETFLPEMRSMVVGKHIIFYRPSPEGIEVLRILYGGRDFRKIHWI